MFPPLVHLLRVLVRRHPHVPQVPLVPKDFAHRQVAPISGNFMLSSSSSLSSSSEHASYGSSSRTSDGAGDKGRGL